MKTRTRQSSPSSKSDVLYDQAEDFDLESLSEEELEAVLFQEDEEPESSIWNLPTAAGLGLIVVGMLYLLQEMNLWQGYDLSDFVTILPPLAGILIILLGFGVLSWRPRRRKKKVKARVKPVPEDRQAEKTSTTEKVHDQKNKKSKTSGKSTFCFEGTLSDTLKNKRIRKSRDKVLAGVCAGLADYFGVDPTLMRIVFVALAVATSVAPVLIAYVVMAIVFPDPPKLSDEERIRIIRDS